MPREMRPENAAEMLHADVQPSSVARPSQRRAMGAGTSSGSGRVRHDEKITVYISSEELLRLEQARLTLRSDHGISVDRGRVVREAVAMCLDDLDAHDTDSALVHRLGSDS